MIWGQGVNRKLLYTLCIFWFNMIFVYHPAICLRRCNIEKVTAPVPTALAVMVTLPVAEKIKLTSIKTQI